MPFPIRVCKICSEEFELKPDHPGYANRCRECNEPAASDEGSVPNATFESTKEANEARRAAMKDMLYSGK